MTPRPLAFLRPPLCPLKLTQMISFMKSFSSLPWSWGLLGEGEILACIEHLLDVMNFASYFLSNPDNCKVGRDLPISQMKRLRLKVVPSASQRCPQRRIKNANSS